MFILTKNLKRISKLAFLAATFLSLFWGLKVLINEAFIQASSRNFRGDFWAAVYGPLRVEHNIFYGPIFTSLVYITDQFPDYLSIHFYGFLSAALLTCSALILCISLGLSRINFLISITLAICFLPTAFSISVAAVPEIMEVLFISLAFHFSTQKKNFQEGVFIGLAALTKFVPWSFLAPLLLQTKWRSIFAICLLFVATVFIASVAIDIKFITALKESIYPVGPTMGYFGPLSISYEFSSLTEFFLRFIFEVTYVPNEFLFNVNAPVDKQLGMSIFIASVLVMLFLIGTSTLLTIAVINFAKKDNVSSQALIYLLWLGILPIITLRSHPHTFVLLFPCFFLLVGIAEKFKLKESIPYRMTISFALYFSLIIFATSYIWIGFPALRHYLSLLIGGSKFTKYLLSEPILGNLLFFVGVVIVTCVYLAIERATLNNRSISGEISTY
jgi:hypothetical protein